VIRATLQFAIAFAMPAVFAAMLIYGWSL